MGMSQAAIVPIHRFEQIAPDGWRNQKLVLGTPVIHELYPVDIGLHSEFKLAQMVLVNPLQHRHCSFGRFHDIRHGVHGSTQKLVSFPRTRTTARLDGLLARSAISIHRVAGDGLVSGESLYRRLHKMDIRSPISGSRTSPITPA